MVIKTTGISDIMIEQKYIQTAIDYKKNVAGKFVLVAFAT